MMMPGRKFSTQNGYRYGFNGKENDDEVKGDGNQQDYGLRIYDGRLGKFLSVDPLTKGYPELTPYQFASNRPIDGIDLDGGEWKASATRYKSLNQTLIQLNFDFVVKIKVINHSKMTDEELKTKLNLVKFGAEKILQNKTTTSKIFKGPIITIQSKVKIEFDFSDTNGNADEGFTLEAVDYIKPLYGQELGTVTAGRVKEIGNTQRNKIELVVADELVAITPISKIREVNSIGNISATLAEEIGHTGSLGHTGTKGKLSYEPDETDPSIIKHTPALDGDKNVMIQGSGNSESTMNFLQFWKIFKEVIYDTKKVETKDSTTPIQ